MRSKGYLGLSVLQATCPGSVISNQTFVQLDFAFKPVYQIHIALGVNVRHG
jgi:hypothetical protein